MRECFALRSRYPHRAEYSPPRTSAGGAARRASAAIRQRKTGFSRRRVANSGHANSRPAYAATASRPRRRGRALAPTPPASPPAVPRPPRLASGRRAASAAGQLRRPNRRTTRQQHPVGASREARKVDQMARVFAREEREHSAPPPPRRRQAMNQHERRSFAGNAPTDPPPGDTDLPDLEHARCLPGTPP